MSAGEWILDTPSIDDVANASFQLVRKGFDPFEVQAFARAAGAELERLKNDNDRLRASLETAEAKANSSMDDGSIASFLGEETTRLLAAARETSLAIVARAEAKSKEMLDSAYEEAQAMRLNAASDVSADRRQASEESRHLLADAKAHRRKMLRDLGLRRDAACAQLTELLEGRDVLVASLAQISNSAADLIGRLDAISASPADFPNLDPEVESDGSQLDPLAVLRVKSGSNGARGSRGTANGAQPDQNTAPTVDGDSSPIMAFND